MTNQGKDSRPTAGSDPGVGDSRHELILAAATRIRVSIDAGYYLEATTLIESILADRLEMRVQFLSTDAENGFLTLERLIKKLNALDPPLHGFMARIEEWKDQRNKVLHQMAKLGANSRESWKERMEHARVVAETGVILVRDVDRRVRELTHEGRRRDRATASCPNALGPLDEPACEWCES